MSEDSRRETAHHRVETRKVGAVPVAALGRFYKQEDWADIPTIVIVERCRYLWNTTTHEVQFYLSFLPVGAQLKGRAIRQPWSIENQEHWILDVTFNEDRCRIRSLNSPRNLAVLRRMCLNVVNQEREHPDFASRQKYDKIYPSMGKLTLSFPKKSVLESMSPFIAIEE